MDYAPRLYGAHPSPLPAVDIKYADAAMERLAVESFGASAASPRGSIIWSGRPARHRLGRSPQPPHRHSIDAKRARCRDRTLSARHRQDRLAHDRRHRRPTTSLQRQPSSPRRAQHRPARHPQRRTDRYGAVPSEVAPDYGRTLLRGHDHTLHSRQTPQPAYPTSGHYMGRIPNYIRK